MKVWIKKNKPDSKWYVVGTNYKDKEDKAYMDLFFLNGTEPEFVPDKDGKCSYNISIEEGKFTSYKNKMGLTVFKYSIQNDAAPVNNVVIEEEELPFY